MERLRTLAACLPRRRPDGDVTAEEVLARSVLLGPTAPPQLKSGLCHACGATAERGAVGVDEESGHWFCADCWRKWATRLQDRPVAEGRAAAGFEPAAFYKPGDSIYYRNW